MKLLFQVSTDEMPKISGSVSYLARSIFNETQSGVLKASDNNVKYPSAASENLRGTTLSIEFGKDVPHENLSPCMAAYGWRRTA